MTPYDLAKHFDRSLGRMWPRARSKLFEGPKRLVELGYARPTSESTGRRKRTVYSITPKGRRALAAWLEEPGSGPELEFEQLMKVFFAEHGSKSAVVTNLEAAQSWARTQIAVHIEVGRGYVEGTGPFQERAAQLVITGRFIAELALMVDRWATWALGVVDGWPDDPSSATPDLASLAELVRALERAQRKATAESVPVR
jgi:DNA-binding PadR family transcriptional regulator